MQIIRHAIAPVPEPQRRIALRADRRQLAKRRWRARAADGTEFGFDLTAPLAPGAIIHRENGTEYVLELLPEPVLEVPWTDWADAALLGWHIGNLHQPVQVLPDRFRTADDPAIRALLERDGRLTIQKESPFQPMAALSLPHPA